MVSRYDDFDPAVRAYRKKCQEIHNQKISSVKKVLDIREHEDRINQQIESFRYRKNKNNAFNTKSK